MRTIALLFLLLTAWGCRPGPETRTYRLRHLSPDDALMLVEPYVPGGAENMRVVQRGGSGSPAVLTVTAPGTRLEQIGQLLAQYDRGGWSVRLRFQVVEADGFSSSDPAIADVEPALRGLFRFRGYRLLGEAMVQATAPGLVQQVVTGSDGTPFAISARLLRVLSGDNRQAVELETRLEIQNGPTLLSTSLTVPDSQTVIVGSATPAPGKRTIILVVRPNIE
jgi:hypothetical protein